MPDDTLTIAQISDLHIGPLPAIPLRLLDLKRLTGFLNWYRKRRFMHLPSVTERIIADVKGAAPDHIAVTGDLANIGLPSEIERAAAWLARIGPPGAVSVIPGNHDIYSKLGGIDRGATALEPWRPYFTSNEHGRRFVGDAEAFPYVRVLRKGALAVALIGLNSAVETPPMIATGRLGTAQLQALARILPATRQAGFARVVMIHHPPQPGGATPHHELIDADAMAAILNEHGAELVMHGHNHRASVTRFPSPQGDVPIVCVPSASMAQVRSNEALARAHFFEFRQGIDATRPHITLIGRGLAEPAGPIVELQRMVLSG